MSSREGKTDDLVERFDAGDDVLDLFDTENPEYPNRELKRVNVDFPTWMVNALDEEAKRIGVNRQAIIKTWIAERLDQKIAAVL